MKQTAKTVSSKENLITIIVALIAAFTAAQRYGVSTAGTEQKDTSIGKNATYSNNTSEISSNSQK